MCGILGIAAAWGCAPSLDDAAVVRLRDLMAHRGPDGSGLWRHENVVLAHRRLAVIDPTAAGSQPMLLTESGVVYSSSEARPPSDAVRMAMVYNGELYNDGALRRELSSMGVVFRTRCDSETVLQAFSAWGTGAFARLRGMFAVGFYDARMRLLTLARDALGVKPLYFSAEGGEVAFASEPGPLVRHPSVSASPNPRMLSAYLTTIRTVLGNETMWRGVWSLRPGEMLQCDLGCSRGGGPPVRLVGWWRGERVLDAEPSMAWASRRVRVAVESSVRAQMRSDVPVCALLSGGLDSTIIAATARRESAGLRTFCAGSPVPVSCGEEASEGDLCFARRAAEALGTAHGEAPVTRGSFLERWRWMVGRMGSPLSTPNEVAIHEVARRLREEGCVVTLSGEGADELFGGYDGPLDLAWRYLSEEGGGAGRPRLSPGRHELCAHAWVPPDFKHGVLSDGAWREAEEDRWLESFYDDEYARAVSECGVEGLEAHLRFHRRVNLTGLLQRLDSATMLAGVEGRTPFADAEVAALAESLPIALKYAAPEGGGGGPGAGGGAVAVAERGAALRTKMVLREAFADAVPGFVLRRAKASFPLPFQSWMGDAAGVLRTSGFAREVFSDAAVHAVAENPSRLWHLAWPMVNVALWGEAMGW